MTTPTDKSEVVKTEKSNNLKWVDRLQARDFENGAVLDHIRSVFKAHDEAQSQLTHLRAQVERLHADGAVMRGALDDICSQDYLTTSKPEDHPVAIASKALSSTNAGRDLLSRYREALELLRAETTLA